MASTAETTQSLHQADPPTPGSSPAQLLSRLKGQPSAPALPFRIRPASLTDASGISALHQAVFIATYAAITPPNDLTTHLASLTSDAYASDIQQPDVTRLWVAESLVSSAESGEATGKTGKIVGFAQTRSDREETAVVKGEWPKPLMLDRLYVSQRYHGTGLARQLTQTVVDEGRKQGYKTLWLTVYTLEARANRFYEKCGFHKIGEYAYWVGNDCQMDNVLVLEI